MSPLEHHCPVGSDDQSKGIKKMNKPRKVSDCKTPEEALLTLICQNRGLQNFIRIDQLIEGAKEHGIKEIARTARKPEIAAQLFPLMDCYAFSVKYGVGVKSVDMQSKFGITHGQVKKLEKAGLINVVGKERFRAFGGYKYAPLYDLWQYFELTTDDVQKELSKLDKRKNV